MDIDNMFLEEIWKEIVSKINARPELINNLNATYEIEITGDNSRKYGLTFSHGKAVVSSNELEDMDCALVLNEKNFKKLLKGNLNATTAFMTGKLKVKGNIGLALKLENLLKKYSL